MKILHMVHNFPPAFFGGTELYVYHVAQTQRRLGHEVVIVTGSDERHIECEPGVGEYDGLKVYRLRRFPRPLILMSDTYDPLLLRVMRDILGEERPDIVHGHHWFNLTTSSLALAATLGIPSVFTFHDLFAVCPRFFRFRPDGKCERATSLMPCDSCCDEDFPFPEWERKGDYELRAAEIARDAAVARRHVYPSEAHRDYLAPLFADGAEKAVVLPHGLPPRDVEIPAPEPIPEAFSPERPLRVGYWGNMVRPKGVITLLDAAKRLAADGVALRIVLWGDVLEPGLEEEIDGYRPDVEVVMRGKYDAAGFAEIRRSLDAACFVSALQESYSFTVDEAAWMGVPVIVSDRGAPKERVGGWGHVVPADDPDAVATAIRAWYERPADLVQHARAATPPAPMSEMAEVLVGLYEDVCRDGAVEPEPVDSAARLELWFKRICSRENWIQDLVWNKRDDRESKQETTDE